MGGRKDEKHIMWEGFLQKGGRWIGGCRWRRQKDSFFLNKMRENKNSNSKNNLADRITITANRRRRKNRRRRRVEREKVATEGRKMAERSKRGTRTHETEHLSSESESEDTVDRLICVAKRG